MNTNAVDLKDFKPGNYFRNDSGKVIKIKGVENSLFVVDNNGKERRVNGHQFMQYIKLNDYKFINTSTTSIKELGKIIELNLAVNDLIRVFSNE
jgi:hypothetical protein